MQTLEEQYLVYIVTPLVDGSSDVGVVRTQDEKGVLLTLHVHPSDMGKVIGRQGQTINAIRHILRNFGMRQKQVISVKVFDPRANTGIVDPLERINV